MRHRGHVFVAQTAEGIALEMMPTDTPLYLIQDWDNTALVGANLVRAD